MKSNVLETWINTGLSLSTKITKIEIIINYNKTKTNKKIMF